MHSDLTLTTCASSPSSSNLESPYGGCVWVEEWQAYCCKNLQHHMLVIESMDGDTETRRLSPIALNGGDTGAGHYTDLINGPMDHGENYKIGML